LWCTDWHILFPVILKFIFRQQCVKSYCNGNDINSLSLAQCKSIALTMFCESGLLWQLPQRG
ncbi:hypothetical protein R7Q48_23920, partial [Vibrio sp. 378]|uniref:hypothetical protein n=1 Tax=Vibrio sp. 378 TaxID=3074603 RepID=UPI0029652871